MPKATLTSRVLKNKDTGLEIQVPTYNVSRELLTSTVHYQVVLASNLACFKLPSHKESDVVQYSVERKMNEFEDVRNKLAALYPGTILPPIGKKSIIVNDAVLRERRASLDHFMKSIASVGKLAISVPVLEFLGVDSLRAKKFVKGEPLDNKTTAAATDDHRNLGEQEEESESSAPIVFGDDEDSGNEDLFGEDSVHSRKDDLFGNEEDDDRDRTQGDVKVFEGQDLKRDLTEEDEKNFSTFVPDAILTRTEIVRAQEEEDNSDLFQIEDDLDQLMILKTDTKKTNTDVNGGGDVKTPTPPTAQSKTTPPSKPSIPSKPKPGIKPKNLTSATSSSSLKPTIPQKPKPSSSSISAGGKGGDDSKERASKATKSSSSKTEPEVSGSIGTVDNLGQDDIMKYLQDNLDSNAEEVDLFS